jgi:hypothetical protein
MGNRPFTFLRVAFMRILVLSIGLLVGLAIASPAFGQSVGGFEFAANAAADTAAIVAGSQPSFYLCGATGDFGAPTLPGLTPEQSAVRVLTDGVTDAEMFGAVAVDVGFVDNVVVNGAGPDLVVFESGAPEAFTVSVFDATTQSLSAPRTYFPAPTGTLGGCGFQLNAAPIDLSDFSVAPDNARALFRIDNLGAPGCCDGADLMDVMALNSGAPAPQPITIAGIPFESNSGADVASVVAGSSPSFFQCGVTPELGLPTLPGLSADAGATTVVSDGSADTEAFGKVALDVGFTDNVVVNGAGPDLAVFESGVPEGFTVAVFDAATGTYSAPLRFDPIGIGFYDHCGFAVNAALVDLSSFGVARLGTVSQLRIDNLGAPGGFEGADLADVRAVHSAVAVPVEAKPGSSIAPINLKAGGILPVALLSTPSLDALAVDPASSAVGDPETGHAVKPVSWTTEDVDGDGRSDLLLRLSIEGLVEADAIRSDTTRLVLTGTSADGRSVIGAAAVRVVP